MRLTAAILATFALPLTTITLPRAHSPSNLAGAVSRPNSQPARSTYVGIPKDEFQPFYRPQEMSQWCWATSTAMVLRHSGVAADQEAIVQAIKGWRVNAPGNALEMMAASNFIMKDTSNKTVVVSGEFTMGAPPPNAVFNHLNRKKPFVLNYNQGQTVGHAVVVYGADVALEHSGSRRQVVIERIYVADPFPHQKIKFQKNGDGSPVLDHFGNPVPEWETDNSGFLLRDNWGRPIPATEPDSSKRFVEYSFVPGEFGKYQWLPGFITGALFVEATSI